MSGPTSRFRQYEIVLFEQSRYSESVTTSLRWVNCVLLISQRIPAASAILHLKGCLKEYLPRLNNEDT